MSSKIVHGPGVVLNMGHSTLDLIRVCINDREYRIIRDGGSVDKEIYEIWQYQACLGLTPIRMCTWAGAMMVGLNPDDLDLDKGH